ncbi:MAG: exonuclease subunit SbcD [Acetatifactor sp.]|nr:exonuclease subunit SbcD [Acetatifactor sp.]
MRILHTSDWHLGMSDQNMSLKEDQIAFIDEICDIVEKESIDVVVIAGDVYDRSLSSGEAKQLYSYAMDKLCVQLKKRVICIAGNHDGPEQLANCGSLLEQAGLFVLGALEKEPVIVETEEADFYLMPWFTEEKVKTLYPEKREEITSLTDAYGVVCDKARETFAPGKKHIAVSHAFISGSTTSTSDRAAVIGFASQVPVSVFEGFDYVALGHIHKPQNVGKNARYSGTPMAYSFGQEEKQEKSVTIIDTKDMKPYEVFLHPLHERTTITGTFEEVMHYDCSDSIRNGFVRADVTDIYLGMEAVSQLYARYPKLVTFSGKTYQSEDGGIRMTMEEFKELESNPLAIFESFCREISGEEPSEHLMKLFLAAMDGSLQ